MKKQVYTAPEFDVVTGCETNPDLFTLSFDDIGFASEWDLLDI